MRLTHLFWLFPLAAVSLSHPARADEAADANPWPLCPADFIIPDRPPFDPALGPDDVEIMADEADIVHNGISDFLGNVTVSAREQAIRADRMRYYQQEERAEFIGNVHFWDDSLYLRGSRAEVELDEERGSFSDTDYMIPSNRGRGHADELYHELESLTRLTQVDYTTCSPEAEFWKVSASEITLNHESEWGSARNAVLRIRNIPVLYTPYATFPISNERKTGFLFPSIGSSSRGGIETLTPFYWNIAPNMDATITPRVMAKRGVMLMTEYRYLFESGEGQVDLEYMPSDSKSDRNYRGIFGLQHRQEYHGGRGRFDVDYAYVTDNRYFEDFGTNLSLSSTRFVDQRAETRYRGDWWRFLARVQSFQTVDRSIPGQNRPYKRLPQIRFGTRLPFQNRALNFHFESEAAYFTRRQSDVPGSFGDVDGARFDIMPAVSYPIRTTYSFVEPKVGVRFTQYNLDSGGFFDKSPNRVAPFASFDSGLFFDRDVNLLGNQYRQTLEPRLYYLYVRPTDQDDLPIFDTGLRDFSFAQLFRENRFTSADRFGDANQVTLALTSRLLDMRRGREIGRASIGQIYYFRDRKVTLRPGDAIADESTSPLVAELATRIIPDWELQGAIQWDPHQPRTEKLSARISYMPDDGRVLNLAYRVRRDDRALRRGVPDLTDLEQTDLSFYWPINERWGVVGRWNYALKDNRTLELFGGVEYESCCWAVRAVARRFLSSFEGDYNTGVFLQFELKGLAGIGRQTATFLERNIRGYEPVDF